MNIGCRESGRFGMHLSPTIETNFVRGCLAANIRTCSEARLLRGILKNAHKFEPIPTRAGTSPILI